MQNIAITGLMTSGKTTLARDIADATDYDVISFAGALKQFAADGLNWGKPIEKSETYTFVPYGANENLILSGREVLQRFGDAVKTIDTNFWTRLVLAQTMKNPTKGYIIDDLRYQFEEYTLKDMGWKIVRINTPEDVRMQRYANLYGRTPTAAEMNHSSEQQILEIAHDIEIDGTADRSANAASVMKSLGILARLMY